jgi:peptide/nickel transport system permease protein
MTRQILRRLLAIPIVAFIANAIGYIYCYYLGPVQGMRQPGNFQSAGMPSVLPSYFAYLKGALRLDLGTLPNGGTVAATLARATLASSGILCAAFVLSILFGITLGRMGVRSDRAVVSRWLVILATIGQSSPTFYIGVLFISVSIMFLIWSPGNTILLPFQGFGWDAHMILPVLALMVRPTLQIAQITANLLSDELGKQYVLVMRGLGYRMSRIRGRFAFRNIMAQVILVIAGSWRMLIVELIILEWLFNWPGLGKLFASSLILSSSSANFLFPPLLASLLSIMAILFLAADLIASAAARAVDPRLRAS